MPTDVTQTYILVIITPPIGPIEALLINLLDGPAPMEIEAADCQGRY